MIGSSFNRLTLPYRDKRPIVQPLINKLFPKHAPEKAIGVHARMHPKDALPLPRFGILGHPDLGHDRDAACIRF
jgi:hypothetical protein